MVLHNAVCMTPLAGVSGRRREITGEQTEIEALSVAGCLSERFGAAQVDGVGFDAFGIELVLADELAETVSEVSSPR